MYSTFIQHCYRLWQEPDKRKHFGVSLALFVMLFCIFALGLPLLGVLSVLSLPLTMAAAAALTLLVGLGKEVWDRYYGSGFCWLDMIANCVGVAAGVVTVLAVLLVGQLLAEQLLAGQLLVG